MLPIRLDTNISELYFETLKKIMNNAENDPNEMISLVGKIIHFKSYNTKADPLINNMSQTINPTYACTPTNIYGQYAYEITNKIQVIISTIGYCHEIDFLQ